MKKILIFASILVPAITVGMTQLQAAQTRHTISMSASVGGVCTFGTPSSIVGFATSTSLLATAVNGKAEAKTATMTLPFVCTSAGVSIQLTSANQGITKPMGATTLQSGQTNKIHYVAKYKIGNSSVLGSFNTETGTATPLLTIVDVPAGDINLDVAITSGITSANTLIAGNYTDSLHVDISPNP